MNTTQFNSFFRLMAVGLGLSLSQAYAEQNLIHRWSFNEGSGTTVTDSQGGANGTLRVASTNGVPIGTVPTLGGGIVTLDGLGGYVDLPNGLISTLTNATIEFWVTWDGGDGNQRLFDFGSMTTNGVRGVEDTDGSLEGSGSTGDSYIFATPDNGAAGSPEWMRYGITPDFGNGGYPVTPLVDPLEFLTGTETHIVCTIGDGWIRMFYGDSSIPTAETGGAYSANLPALSQVNDVNNWLGRSQWDQDPYFGGSFDEFRIHGSMLTAQEIRASQIAGPDSVDYNPGVASSITMVGVKNNMVVGNVQSPSFSADFANVGTVDLESPDLDSLTSSAPSVVAVDAGGRLVALAPGSATITATVDSATDNLLITVTANNPELKNRWSFNESPGASQVIDSVGGMNGTVVASSTTNVTLTGTQASFPGGGYQTAPYIDLPDGIISARTNITIEGWFTWRGPSSQYWQRLFDMGSSSKVGGYPTNSGNGSSSLFLTPLGGGNNGLRFVALPEGGSETARQGPVVSLNTEHHFAAVYAPDSLISKLYLDGIEVDSGGAPFALSQISDTNNWVGVSQWNDPGLNGSINELRIYEGVLTDLDIALRRHAGPDVSTVSAPGSLLSLSVPDVDILLGQGDTQALLLATFQNYSDVEIQGVSGVLFEAGGTNVFTTTPGGLLSQNSIGTGELIGSYSGMSATGMVSVLGPTLIAIQPFSGPLTAGEQTNATLLANFSASITNVDVSGFEGVNWTSSNPSVLSVGSGGVISPVLGGSVTLTASYGGLTSQLVVSVEEPPGYDPTRIDDFESYDLGNVGDVASPPWTTSESAFYGNIASNANNKFITQYGSGDFRDLRISTPWRLTTEGTLSFDVYVVAETNINYTLGLSRNENMDYYPDYGPMVRLLDDNGGNGNGLVGLDARDDAVYVKDVALLNLGQWYTIKMVIDTAGSGGIGDYDLYVDDVLVYTGGGFRYHYNDPSDPFDPLDVFVMMVGPEVTEGIRVDNIYLIPPVVPVSPQLSVSSSGGNVLISWPTNDSAGFVLEGTSALGAGASWSTNGISAPTMVGGRYQVTIPASASAGYYRLAQ